jgi:hypothetical protein
MRDDDFAAGKDRERQLATEAWERAKADPTCWEAAVFRESMLGNEAVERAWLGILRRREPGVSWRVA